MFLGVQYFRPPFPDRKYWDSDLDRMKASGIDTVQLWACWGWVEPEPGKFDFSDYDELIEKCRQRGLKVVISTLAEIHPYWIHRIVPGSEMIDVNGRKVVSTPRKECIAGLTPGGCFDNPQVLELMGNFLDAITKRYADKENLTGWDSWNEIRWNVHAETPVCYCGHTMAKFKKYLDEKYGGLEGLNRAWKVKFCSWEDVAPPKWNLFAPSAGQLDFAAFITQRTREHARFRYGIMKKNDAKHPVIAHCSYPSTLRGHFAYDHVLNRGNDWELADELDGFGCSYFPLWGDGFDFTGLGYRVESVRSAARGKIMWVSELQGGAVRYGYDVHREVTADTQQTWIWNGFARGAKGAILWCWKDEVFGIESSGFGVSGNDGFAGERLAALKKTGGFMRKHEKLLDNYLPDDPKVGVVYEPDNYRLDWATTGAPDTAFRSLYGYLTALEKIQVPYEVLESSHTDILEKLNLVIIPWPISLNASLAKKLEKFVKNGGTVMCEGETDAFDALGFYR